MYMVFIDLVLTFEDTQVQLFPQVQRRLLSCFDNSIAIALAIFLAEARILLQNHYDTLFCQAMLIDNILLCRSQMLEAYVDTATQSVHLQRQES